jgi:hypothetical protein
VIGLFRSNNPLSLLFLVALACIPHFYAPITIPLLADISSNETMAYIFKWASFGLFEANTIWGDLISIVVTVAEGLILNKIVSDNKFAERPGYITAMTFVMANSLIPYEQQSYMLLINALLILALKNLISIYKKDKPINAILFAGFYIGIVSSFETFYFIFFGWLTIALLIMRPASLREWIILFIGFGLPFYFLISFLYLTNDLIAATIFKMPSFKISIPSLSGLNWVKFSILIFLPLIGFSVANKHVGKILIHGRKSYLLFLVLFLTVITLCIISFKDIPFCFYLLPIPFSVLTTHLYTSSKRNIVPHILLFTQFILCFLR